MNASSEQPDGSWIQRFAGESEMGTLVAAFDWESTSLGPPARWSVELRAAVGMCLSTRFPVLVVCGPEMIKVYNDGYRAILGTEKHPMALGAPVTAVWQEIWDVIGPRFDHVYETGEATWSEDELLVIDRNGFLEDCYFTYSYSPIMDAAGAVHGVVDIVSETTEAVVFRERLGCIADLTSTLVEAEGVTDVCLQATAVFSRWTSAVRAVDVYLRVDDRLLLTASNRRGEHPAVDPAVADGRSVLEVLRDHPPTGRPGADVTVPIGGTEDGAVGAMVFSLSRGRPYDAQYVQFVELAARSVGAALDRAHRHAVELNEYRTIGDTLQQAMLQPAADFVTVAARYLPAAGNLAVGGDWYDVIQLPDGRRGLVVGDCVGHGLDAAAAMSQLRSAARAMLLQGSDPAGTLNGLDQFARSIAGAFCTTAVCMVVDAREGVITYARAGHPYPLVAGPDGPTWLDQSNGPPLGFLPSPAYENAVYRMGADDLLVLYSDGLIERRDENIDEGFERLANVAAKLTDGPVEQTADQLLAELLPPVPPDDVVVVVKKLPRQRGPRRTSGL